MGTDKIVGYARVSSADQNPHRQIESISGFVEREYNEELYELYTDKVSGRDTDRPELQKLDRFVRDDDVVSVHSPDRLARSTRDLLNLLAKWRQRGVKVRFVTQPTFDQTDSAGKLMLTLLAGVAEFERDLSRERQREGIEVAKKNGKYKPTRGLTPEQAHQIRQKHDAGFKRNRLTEDYGVSGSTIYNVTRMQGLYGTSDYLSYEPNKPDGTNVNY